MGTATGPAVGRAIRLLGAFPELGDEMPVDLYAAAADQVVAAVEALEPGVWQPSPNLQSEPGHLGFLVVEGLITRSVVLGDATSATATELLGRGDLLRPADHDDDVDLVPVTVVWTVLEPTLLAVLDRRFMTEVARLTEVRVAIMRMALQRTSSLALQLAVGHLRRVDMRLLVLFWHLANRWGWVESRGIVVPLRLTHQTLGGLVGAQRSSVTTALSQLDTARLLTKRPDGTWLVQGEPPTEFCRVQALVTGTAQPAQQGARRHGSGAR